jgi:hypothetical protein
VSVASSVPEPAYGLGLALVLATVLGINLPRLFSKSWS